MKHYKLSYKTTGETVEFKMPTSWADVSFNKFVQLDSLKTDSEFIAVLSGLEKHSVRDIAQSNKFIELVNDLQFLKQQPSKDMIPPSFIAFAGVKVKTPIDIAMDTLGQYEDLKNSIKVDGFDRYLIALAIYLQPIKDGTYNLIKAKKLSKEVGELPCELVLTMGGFFLMKLYGLKDGYLQTYQRASLPVKRLRLVILNWVNSLASCLRLTT